MRNIEVIFIKVSNTRVKVTKLAKFLSKLNYKSYP